MPNYAFPTSEEDQSYLNQLNRGTDSNINQTNRFADQMSDSTRRQGAIIGDALRQAPSDYMEGARFKSSEESAQQQRDINAANENRTEQLFGPKMKEANLSNDLSQADLSNRQFTNSENSRKRDFSLQAPSQEEAKAAGVPWSPSLTREQMDYAANLGQGAANVAATRAGTSSTYQNMAQTQRQNNQEDLANAVRGGGLNLSSPPQGAPSGQRSLNLTDMTTPPQGSVRLASTGMPQSSGPAPMSTSPGPSGQSPPLAEEQVAALAKKYKTTPEAVRAEASKQEMARETSKRELASAKEANATITPDIAAARVKAGKIASNLQQLSGMMDTHIGEYDKAANKGGKSITGRLAEMAGVRGLPGASTVGESGTQSRLREEMATKLREMGLDQEADHVSASMSLTPATTRMNDAAISAMKKSKEDLESLVGANSSLKDDRIVKEAIQSYNEVIGKYKNQLNGVNSPPNLSGNRPISNAMMRGLDQ